MSPLYKADCSEWVIIAHIRRRSKVLCSIANHWSGVEDQLLVWVFLRKEILLAGSFLTPFFEVWGMHQLSEMEETFMEGDGSSHISSWYWIYSSIRIHPSSSWGELRSKN
ncbi:hypothetical protein Tco_0007065 [Tanacetum coccineum]